MGGGPGQEAGPDLGLNQGHSMAPPNTPNSCLLGFGKPPHPFTGVNSFIPLNLLKIEKKKPKPELQIQQKAKT